MKNTILFLCFSFCIFSAKAQTQKVTFTRDTCLFKFFSPSYIINDAQTPSGAYIPLNTYSIDVPKGKYLHLKLEFKNGVVYPYILNGISTLDLVLITKHILGTQILKTPQALLAADVNNNGAISIADVVELRSLILGQTLNFSNNTSWRIYSPDKFLSSQATTGVFSLLIQKDEKLTFIPVKIGDVNGSADSIWCF
jgi:hypothetical protein